MYRLTTEIRSKWKSGVDIDPGELDQLLLVEADLSVIYELVFGGSIS